MGNKPFVRNYSPLWTLEEASANGWLASCLCDISKLNLWYLIFSWCSASSFVLLLQMATHFHSFSKCLWPRCVLLAWLFSTSAARTTNWGQRQVEPACSDPSCLWRTVAHAKQSFCFCRGGTAEQGHELLTHSLMGPPSSPPGFT